MLDDSCITIEFLTVSKTMKLRIKIVLTGVLLLMFGASARAQFLDATTGLLSMPTATMNPEGTFMITANFLNKHYTPTWWSYHTFGYGFDVALFKRLEVAYVMAIMKGTRAVLDPDAEGGSVTINWVNQDRHFSAKILLFREGEFGVAWMPALAIGVSDLTSASRGGYETGVDDKDNGYFNRYYAVATKHFNTAWGEVGAHLGYQTNQLFVRRKDRVINAPCAGVDWKPVWLQDRGFFSGLDVILEYDSLSVNLGFIASLWGDRLQAMFDLQSFRWVSFGLRYKLHLR